MLIKWWNFPRFSELIRDVLLWIPTHGHAKAGRPARTYIQQLCEDTGCCPEDLPRAMNDREEWRERVRDIRAASTIWWWWWWWYESMYLLSKGRMWHIFTGKILIKIFKNLFLIFKRFIIFTNPSAWAGYNKRSIFEVEFNRFEFRVFFLLD